jgi:hypothetical protein
MINFLKKTVIISMTAIFTACVPSPQPTPTKSNLPPIGVGSPTKSSLYGYPPKDYKNRIKNYFSNKIKRANLARYEFSKPQRAYKREALAYGGNIGWRGWLVDITIETESRTGRRQNPKPYMVLFTNSLIVEDIVGSKHKLITRVGD